MKPQKKWAASIDTIGRDLSHERCLIPISVGQPYHEGNQFEATLRAVKEKFKTIKVVVASSLQRYTLLMKEKEQIEVIASKEILASQQQPGSDNNIDIMIAHKLANIKGVEWYARNKDVIDKYFPTAKIIYWDQLIGNHEFQYLTELVNIIYEKNHNFREAVNQIAGNFVGILAKRQIPKYDAISVATLSIKYIKEEVAVLCSWMIDGDKFIIYPVHNSPPHSAIINFLDGLSANIAILQDSLINIAHGATILNYLKEIISGNKIEFLNLNIFPLLTKPENSLINNDSEKKELKDSQKQLSDNESKKMLSYLEQISFNMLSVVLKTYSPTAKRVFIEDLLMRLSKRGINKQEVVDSLPGDDEKFSCCEE